MKLYCSLYHQIIIFQHGTWKWKDDSVIRYINWASRYPFPTKYKHFNKNRLVSRILSPGTRLERYQSQDDGRCSAALMAPDFTRVLLFPVDCSRNFTSRIVCVARRLNNKSLDDNDHSVELDYVGYQTQQHTNNSILELSQHICPEGYNFGYRNVCLQLVRFPEFLSARTVSQCATWIYEIMKISKCEDVMHNNYGHAQHIIDSFLHKYYESQKLLTGSTHYVEWLISIQQYMEV